MIGAQALEVATGGRCVPLVDLTKSPRWSEFALVKFCKVVLSFWGGRMKLKVVAQRWVV